MRQAQCALQEKAAQQNAALVCGIVVDVTKPMSFKERMGPSICTDPKICSPDTNTVAEAMASEAVRGRGNARSEELLVLAARGATSSQ